MAIYELLGLRIETVPMEVEANNLEEAIDKCYAEYDICEIDDYSSIGIDGKLLQDKHGDLVLADIAPCDYHKY